MRLLSLYDQKRDSSAIENTRACIARAVRAYLYCPKRAKVNYRNIPSESGRFF
jgi:hypothetical protein